MKKWLGSIAALILFLSPLTAFAASYAGVESFDSYSTGALNGLNGGTGWAGAWSATGVALVESTTVFQGANAMQILNGGGTGQRRILSASINSGDLYFAYRTNNLGLAGAFSDFGINDASDDVGGGATIISDGSNSNLDAFSNAGNTVLISNISGNTWYIVHIQFLSSTTFKAQAKVSGGSFGSFTGTLTYSNSMTNPDRLYLVANGITATYYFDSIQTTDPQPPVTSVGNAYFHVWWW